MSNGGPTAGASGAGPAAEVDVGSIARSIYRGGGVVTRLMQHHRHRIAPMARLVASVPDGSSVLDAGCGGGLLLNCLASARRIRSAHGFDSSRAAIATAQAAARELAASGAPVVPTFEHRPVQDGFPAGSFDVVCLVDVLHHVPPNAQERAFREAASRVRPGGYLLYKDMCDSPAWRAGLNRAHDLLMARQWINYLAIESADQWASEMGLIQQVAESMTTLWYGHEMRLYKKEPRV